MSLAAAAVPLAAAAVLLAAPARAGAPVSLAASVLTLIVACRSAGPDAAGTLLALLSAAVGTATAWFALHGPARAGRGERWRDRTETALFQAALGGTLLAVLADDLLLGWTGLAVGTAAVAAMRPGTEQAASAGRRRLVASGAALGLALAGILVLAAAIRSEGGSGPMSWSGLAQGAPGARPGLLNVASCLLVAGWGSVATLIPLHAWTVPARSDRGSSPAPVLTTLIVGAALVHLLRLRGIASACPAALSPGPAIVALGLASALGGAALMRARSEAGRLLALSTVQQGGLVAAAFGLGGAAASAGMLLLGQHALLRAALPNGAPPGGRGADALWLAVCLGLAGLSPAGVLAGEFSVIAEAMRAAPAVAILAGLGIAVASHALLTRLSRSRRDRDAAEAVDRKPIALLGAWASLAAALGLGVAAPPSVAALLQAVGR